MVRIAGAAHKPEGDLILCDVAREDASVIIGDLKELDVPDVGSIAVEQIDSAISDAADEAEQAAPGLPSDAVVWEEVESRTSRTTELSVSFLASWSLAMLIAAVGILLDQPILIVGAMVVGPEFGPLAALCVALVQRQRDLARRSLIALWRSASRSASLRALLVVARPDRAPARSPDDFTGTHPLTAFISQPRLLLSFFVAFLAGIGGHALADHRQVGRADRRADLRDDDPRRVQHRRRGRLRGLGRGRRRRRAARR